MKPNDFPEEIEVFFNKKALEYEAHMTSLPNHDLWRQLFEKSLPSTTDELNILDLGCGTGIEIKNILNRIPNAMITCIDISEEMLKILKSNYKEKLHQLKIIKASYIDFEFGKDCFDLVIACMTMHHLSYSEKLKVYKKILSSLKPNGKYMEYEYLVDEDEEKAMYEKYNEFTNSEKFQKGTQYHIDIPFTSESEKKVLKEVGFVNIEIISIPNVLKSNAAIITASKTDSF